MQALQDPASIPLEHVRRPRNTPIWKLEAALKCRSCRTPRYAPPVHMIKLTKSARSTRICGCIRTRSGDYPRRPLVLLVHTVGRLQMHFGWNSVPRVVTCAAAFP